MKIPWTNIMDPAPVILFVYNRPLHTKRTIEALQQNSLARESELHIFSDNAETRQAEKGVALVRKYIRQIGGFKKVSIHERDRNWGLADNIISGVTEVVTEYGKGIVLEDDCVTSRYFLDFMNNALSFYKDIKRVWHVSGWNYPIKNDGKEETFLWRVMNCWGWATWDDRWSYFEKDTEKLIGDFTKEDIKRFNLDGAVNFWDQVLANRQGRINSWAIYWYATIFLHNGLCLNPVQTFVDNIGHDGSGKHCFGLKGYIDDLNQSKTIAFEESIFESKKYVKLIKKTMKKGFYQSVKKMLLWK